MPPRLARLLAILGVIALVAGAFVLRGTLSDDDDTVTAGGSGGSGDDPGEVGDGPFQVVCDDDLGEVCDLIEELDGVDSVMVLRAGDAVDALTDAEADGTDLWVTVDPMPAVLDVAASVVGAGTPTSGTSIPIASATPAVLAYPDSDPACTDEPTWDCLAAAADDLRIGVPSLDTATGTLLLAHAASGLLEPDSIDFGISEVTEDDAIRDALEALLDSGTSAPTAKQASDLVVQRGSYDAIVTTDDLASVSADSPRGKGEELTVAILPPDATLGVVAAPIGPDGEDALDRLRGALTGQDVADALADAGWGGDPAPSAGLPDPDVIYALVEEFNR